MKTWKRYKEYLLKGEWHIHTSYTDGENSIAQYCEIARELHIPLIAFTEHVRTKLDYNFSDFLSDIKEARKAFPDITILSGCEAKVSPGGELDASEELLGSIDYPIFAFHSFPDDLDLYINCLKKIIKNSFVCAWAHPGLFLRKHNFGLDNRVLLYILELLKEHDVLLEMNRRYDLPPEHWRDIIKMQKVYEVNGNDVHSILEFRKYASRER